MDLGNIMEVINAVRCITHSQRFTVDQRVS